MKGIKTGNPEEPSTSNRPTVLLANILAGNENRSGRNFQTKLADGFVKHACY
jgi:hypothetical protein